jgi:phosphoglycolate phosphatase
MSDATTWRPLAVLFDFDGTLADSYAAITASVNHVRAHHHLPPLGEPEVRHHVGRGPEHLLRNTVPGGDLPADLARYRGHHPSVMYEMTRLLPGAMEEITKLHRGGIKLGVCSNKPAGFTRELLNHLKLAPLLDVVIGFGDVPRPKPAPDMLLTALGRLDVPPKQDLYVGDMVVDIECAGAARIRVWVVPSGSEEPAALAAAKPDQLLGSLHDLIPALGLCSAN